MFTYFCTLENREILKIEENKHILSVFIFRAIMTSTEPVYLYYISKNSYIKKSQARIGLKQLKSCRKRVKAMSVPCYNQLL